MRLISFLVTLIFFVLSVCYKPVSIKYYILKDNVLKAEGDRL